MPLRFISPPGRPEGSEAFDQAGCQDSPCQSELQAEAKLCSAQGDGQAEVAIDSRVNRGLYRS